MVRNAIYYLDERIKEEYDLLIKYKADLKLNHLGYTQIQYLYARSYFLSMLPLNENYQVAFDFIPNRQGNSGFKTINIRRE